ncbi:ECF RNA polymerase sigma factor SigW [Candidatus Thermoflexus japonica]|uniref:ECF RNA polymerase sigma factor SigW n=1 Tax=Candidatus Thermoflexus japonica TaxID=2035417 RepID=A0A2H5Y5H2_9CHLR|nr:ECF RNA polymerase sigma factor SigW [Candidatus Thermoflexus japonica]
MDQGRTEQEVIRRWRAGDPEGLAVLVRLYELRALRTAYLILQDRMDAEDAVQNAFLRAWIYRRRFDPQRPFWPWFLQLVIREARRIAGRRPSTSVADTGSDADRADIEEWKDPGHAPDLIAERKESARALQQALQRLSPAQRTAIVLRYYHGLAEKEIAGIMGCSVGAVKHYLYEARLRLRDMLNSGETQL